MKWILLVLGILVGLVALAAILGALLPREHVASRTVRLSRPPEEVWAAITEFAAHPSWRADLKAMERLPDRNGHAVWREVRRTGPMTLEVVESQPPNRLVTRIADPDLPFGGSWTYEIRGSDGGSLVTISENGEIYNPIFRLMARFVFGYHATMDAYLSALGKKFGEAITPG